MSHGLIGFSVILHNKVNGKQLVSVVWDKHMLLDTPASHRAFHASLISFVSLKGGILPYQLKLLGLSVTRMD